MDLFAASRTNFSWRPRTAVGAAALLAIVLAGGDGTGVPVGAAQGVREDARPRVGQAGAPGEAPSAASAPASGVKLERIWWNRSAIVESLGLTSAQRAAMDGLLLDFVGQRRDIARASAVQRRSLNEAAVAGDRVAAESAAKGLAGSSGLLAAAEARLRIEVILLLDEAQRERLVQSHQQILRVSWTRSRPLGGPRSRPAPR